MAKSIELEEFSLMDSDPLVPAAAQEPEPLPEDARLEAFEQGYKAGWDDANAALERDQARITADLESNLRDLSFTFYEARGHILQSIEPLIRDLVGKVLPMAAGEGLPALVAERVATLVADVTEAPVILSVHPGARAAVEGLIPGDPGFPITIKEDESLSDGQVFLTLGAQEEAIDMGAALSAIETAVRDFFDLNERQVANG